MRSLVKGRGDIKGSQGDLEEFSRLRIGGIRILHRQISARCLQAIQHHELKGPVGRFTAPTVDAIREALRYAMGV